jgi:two-component system, cell cycle response regulator
MKKISLLLIEDDPADTELIRLYLGDVRHATIDIASVNRLSDAIKHLDDRDVDVILTDLGLPDSNGLGILDKIHEKKPETPIIVLSGLDDEALALEAVKSGAQDYLIKGHIDDDRLMRSILYSIERNRLMQELKEITITDDLTGLYNRRGFLVLAKKQLEMAARFDNVLWLIYLDIDDMKWINDNLGHKEGDRSLVDMSNILKQTFRESDILARIGGDEFATIAVNEGDMNSTQMLERVRENIKSFNAKMGRPYKLSVSMGSVSCDAVADCDINELLSMADQFMYKEKIIKKEQIELPAKGS